MQYYRGYIFLILKYRVLICLSGVRVKRGFNEGFSFLTTKEIITLEDDVYNFVGNFESRGYKDLGKRKNGKNG